MSKAIARGLAEAGADVVIATRDEDELHAAAAEVGAGLGARVRSLVRAIHRPAKAPEANLFTGALSTGVSIAVPPGRKNLTPNLWHCLGACSVSLLIRCVSS